MKKYLLVFVLTASLILGAWPTTTFAASGSDIVDDEKSDIYNIEQTHYAVLYLNSGTEEDYNITLNGTLVTPSKVNDRGSIVKFPVNPYEVCQVQVREKGGSSVTETVNLGSGTKPFTGVLEGTTPERVITSGPVSVFDYHLTNYDEDGNSITDIKKTTFTTDAVTSASSKRPDLHVEKTPIGSDVVVTFDGDSHKGQEWQKNIEEVLLDYGTSASARVPLEYRVSKGKVTILSSSTPIDNRNGEFTAIIKAKGYSDAKVHFEIVKPAGNILLSQNFNWWANNDLLFYLEDMNYAITNPVHTVILDGEELKGNCVDWHVVSNLVRLERGALPLLGVGPHDLTIKVTGYEDFHKSFMLFKAPGNSKNPILGSKESSKEENHKSAPVTFDALSAATGGGGSGGSGGGGGTMRANIIFQFDHIANAKILAAVGAETTESAKVINWWDSLTKDAVMTTDINKLVSYIYVKNRVGFEKDGEYVTFKSYYDSLPAMPTTEEIVDPDSNINPALYINKPYNVKNMLNDGLLGTTYSFSDAANKVPPVVEDVTIAKGESITVAYKDNGEGDDWINHFDRILLNYNSLNYAVDKDAKTITFSQDNLFVQGANEIKVYSEGYRTVEVTITITNKVASDLKAEADSNGNIIIKGLSPEQLDKLSGITLDGKVLFNDSQVGGTSGSYGVVADGILLKSKLFGEEVGQFSVNEKHNLKINTNGFDTVNFAFVPKDSGLTVVETKDVPSYVSLQTKAQLDKPEDVKIKVANQWLSQGDAYAKAITKVVDQDGNAVTTSVDGEMMTVDKAAFEAGKTTTLTIKAEGYKDKSFDITVKENPIPAEKEVAKQALDSYVNTSDYRAAERELVENAIAEGKTAIDNATTSEAISEAKKAATDKIDAIKTDAQLTAEDQGEAAKVDTKIDAIGEVTLDKAADIAVARESYNDLTDAQKAMVKNLDALETAEADYVKLKEQEAQDKVDKAATKAVEDKINGLGEITLEKADVIEDASKAYDSLTDA